MKIAYIVPGSGGSFYCGNCLRDKAYILGLKKSGYDSFVIPMYLPLSFTNETNQTETPIFYGAVNLYLQETIPVFKKFPKWIKNKLNSLTVLKYAAKQAGSTNATGLESMTISMLQGKYGRQKDELQSLIEYLKKEKTDLVHLSNALLSGLAPAIKSELAIPVICSLQDEDEWIDEMQEPFKTQAWQLIESNADSISQFVSVSNFFKNLIAKHVNIDHQKITTIHNGIELKPKKTKNTDNSFTIGFMARMNANSGLEILVDAFINLVEERKMNNLKLKISGGYTKTDKKYLKKIKSKIENTKCKDKVEIINDLSDDARQRFFDDITIFSYPSIRNEAFGIQLLEAISAGVPVIQPNQGGYPEIIEKTKAGLLYQPNNYIQLSNTLYEVLSDKEKLSSLQLNCISGIENHFSIQNQVVKMIKLYEKAFKI